MKLFTIGFTKNSAEEFFSLIKKSGTQRVIDVRLNNTSQLAGFAKQDDLTYFLKALCQVDYIHCLELAPTEEILTPYRHKEHTWQQFKDEFVKLLAERQVEKHLDKQLLDHSCLLCGEEKPDHCHREFIIEYLQAHWKDKITVAHLI